MKAFGIVLLFLGIVVGILSFNMDTSIPTAYGEIINDIGLAFDRRNYIIGSACIALFGLCIFLFSKK